MPREVTDQDGITWRCTQVYSGLTESEENKNAAQVDGKEDYFYVVCTPSRGAQSVRLELKGEWESAYSDEQLLRGIKAQHERIRS